MFDAVCIWKVDRLARQVTQGWLIAAEFQEAGVALMCVEDHVDTSDAMGQAIFGFVVAQAQAESESIGKRVSAAWAADAALGKPHIGGVRVFGYTQQMELHPTESLVAREAVDLMLEGASLNSVARMLNDREVWTGAGKPWRAVTLRQWLRGPAIAGIRTHRGVETQGTWTAIITPEERQQLLVLLGQARPDGRADSTVKWLLTGLVKCSECGERMYVSNTGKFPKYSCRPAPGTNACGRVHVTREGLDRYVVGEMFDFLTTARLRPVPADRDPEVLRSLLADDTQKLEALNEARFIDGDISKEEWKPRHEQLTGSIEATRAALTTAEGEVAGLLRPGSREDLEGWWSGADIVQRRQALAHTLRSVIVRPAEGRGPFKPERVEVNFNWGAYARASEVWVQTATPEQIEDAQRINFEAGVDSP